jgi:membrane-associated protease RseP (regulator of RpoE activity)
VSPQDPAAAGEYSFSAPAPERAEAGERYWLHALLLALTLAAATVAGARLAHNFAQNVPPFADGELTALLRLVRNPASLAEGLPFSLTLLTILMAHEMGHYLACVYYRIDASLPYFLPAPTLIGTLGAFIRIRSAIGTRRELFDVGVAGPLAGFVFLVPALAVGVAYSKVIPGVGAQGEVAFGVPLLEQGLRALLFPGVAAEDFYLHPVGRAAWVGMLATALNLLPIGQLDGGHILYAFAGRWHRALTNAFLAALIPMGWFYSWSWWAWAVLLWIFARRHPRIQDPYPLGTGRAALALLSAAIFVLCFSAVPVRLLLGAE